MFDFKFDWCADMEIGDPQIDEQHKELFRIGRDIEQLVMCHCIGVTNQQLLNIVLEVRNYTGYHFYHEEEIMKEINYPDYEDHKAKHDVGITYILNFDCKRLGLEPYESLCELKTFLQDWIFSHILIDDVKLGKYIKSQAN